MLAFVHNLVVSENSNGHLEYSTIALLLVAFINIGACGLVRFWGSDTRLFEAASGVGVAATCLLTLLIRGTYFPRQVISTTLVVFWSLRLAAFLYVRGLKKERLNVLVRVIWSLLCAIPVVICNTRQAEVYESTQVETIALTLAGGAIVMEHLADAQKMEWHARHAHRPGRGEVETPVCTQGLWAYSRHANLFFELLFQWCIYVIVRPVEQPAIVACPVVLTVMILFFPGGVLSQEVERGKLYGMYPSYVRYVQTVPVLFPLPFLRRWLSGCWKKGSDTACLEMDIFTTAF